MRYIPNSSPTSQQRMLRALGLDKLDRLFSNLPDSLRQKPAIDLPDPLDESALISHFRDLSKLNANAHEYACFLGGGAYYHYIPAALDHILLRSEFYTCYTPYQAEISQGTLQAMFEFQTYICELTGLEVANSSMYDGASSLAEALLMAMRVTGRNKVAISQAVHPHYRRVVATYLDDGDKQLIELPFTDDGLTDLAPAADLGADLAALVLQSPNFFGCFEGLSLAADLAHQLGGLLVVGITEPLSLGLAKPPGELGADLVAGEGQSFGLPLSFGGPYLGIFAARGEYLRSMPGRIVGQTLDEKGRTGYVLTLGTREQHIRREQATSNICTNHALCALAATTYLALLGKEGLTELALLNLAKAKYCREQIENVPGIELRFLAPTFNEFVVKVSGGVDKKVRQLAEEGVWAGLPLAPFYPQLEDCLLICCTEMVSRQAIDQLVEGLAQR
jgi:glycine dehydrogenase subunit 1